MATAECLKSGITAISHFPRHCWEVKNMPEGMKGVYQLGFPVQLAPDLAAVVLNIRYSGVKAVDLEIGSDLLFLDELGKSAPPKIIPLDRSERFVNPLTGKEVLLAKYPKQIGFVPLGARMPSGRPHPHAGTGFVIGQVMGFPPESLNRSDCFAETKPEDVFYGIEMAQCSFDGKDFRIWDSRIFRTDELLPGCLLGGNPLSPAIPDGEELISGSSGEIHPSDSLIRHCGILRWHRKEGVWAPYRYIPVAGLENEFHTISGVFGNFVEPSLARAADGTLFFTAREVGPDPFGKGPQEAERIMIWRSADNGETWTKILEKPHFHPLTPLSINSAADGTIYVAANGYCTQNSKGESLNSIILRETLVAWPLKQDEKGSFDFGKPISICDANASFAKPPFGSFWRLDHPVAMTVRLKDRKWHHIICFRVLEHNECDSDAPVTDFTGTYIEEIYSAGETVPVWNFQADGSEDHSAPLLRQSRPAAISAGINYRTADNAFVRK